MRKLSHQRRICFRLSRSCSRKSWTVAIRSKAGAEPRKITKIVSLVDGGFSIVTPYHRARSGFLAQLPMPIGVGPHVIRWSEGITFSAESRVKLSYHADGFAQFSGEASEKIISGIDHATGQPKGLGLHSNPLSTPTWRGPVASITVWGIDDYLLTSGTGNGTIVFEQDEVYYRRCSPYDADGWVLTIHVFPKNPPLPVRFRDNLPFVHVGSESNGVSPLLYMVEYRIVDFENSPVVLGLNLNRVITNVPSKSGWTLSGPSEPGLETAKRYRLMALYPRTEGLTASNGPLDRNAANAPKDG
jgi:hypothetical protein